jgi:predicted nucleotide-binding protein
MRSSNATHDKIRVFIISSAEAREVARTIQNAFERDPFTTIIWTDDVFKIAHYTLQSLEDQVAPATLRSPLLMRTTLPNLVGRNGRHRAIMSSSS